MLNIENRTVELFPSARPGAPLVVVNTVMGEGEALHEAARAATEADFTLAAIGNLDWETDMTPWPAPSLGKGNGTTGGGADACLEQLTGRLLPEIIGHLDAPPAWTALAGYSLGGLFALYAPYRTDAFDRVASASGSLWYPGFIDFALSRELRRRPESVYLSLGDKESRTRNPLLRSVEDNTRRLYEALLDADVRTIFELNPGGHFKDENRRMARAITWTVENDR